MVLLSVRLPAVAIHGCRMKCLAQGNNMQGPLQIIPPMVINLEVNALQGAHKQSRTKAGGGCVEWSSSNSSKHTSADRGNVNVFK